VTIRNARSRYPRKEGISLDMFTEEELRQIHYATLEVLWNEGLHVGCEEARNIFKDGGAVVDHSEGVVRIPPYLVEDAIKSAPSTIIMAGRDPKYDCVIDGSRVNFTPFGAGVCVIDLDTGELRETTKDDLVKTAILADYLDGVDIYSHAVSARDCPVSSVDLHEAEAFLSNTTKHCMHIDLTCGENAKKYVEMAAAIVGGKEELNRRPIASALTCPQSPLQLHKESCDIIIELGKVGLPVNILSMAMSGATTPVTIAGTLVVHNAEVLGGIVLSQLANKGAPVLYGSSTTTFDLQYATAPVGSPELGLCSAGVAALAQFYLLPSYVAGT
jgi:trimethylamine--corrinoid protein Co-methyltransferase